MQMTRFIDIAKRFPTSPQYFPDKDEFDTILQLHCYLRTTYVWKNLPRDEDIVSVKKYKKAVIKMAKIGIENTYLVDEEHYEIIKKNLEELANRWNKKGRKK